MKSVMKKSVKKKFRFVPNEKIADRVNKNPILNDVLEVCLGNGEFVPKLNFLFKCGFTFEDFTLEKIQ